VCEREREGERGGGGMMVGEWRMKLEEEMEEE
jgi:hypothetical protein